MTSVMILMLELGSQVFSGEREPFRKLG